MIYFDNEKCLNFKYQNSTCNLCREVCEIACIDKDNNVNNDICINCGLCISNCPTEAIMGSDYKKSLFNNIMSLNVNPLIITCEKSSNRSTFPCLGILNIRLLLSIVLNNTSDEKQIILRTSKCIDCNKNVYTQLSLLVKHLNKILKSLKKNEVIFEDFKKIEDTKNTSRRFFLKNISFKAINTVYDNFNEIKSEEYLSYEEYFQKYSEQVVGIPSEKLFYSLYIKNNCNFCRICESLCPNNAIEIKEIDKKIEFFHDSLLCKNCKVCVENCKNEELGITEADRLGKNKVYEGEKQYCKICKNIFSPILDKEICLDCYVKKTPRGFGNLNMI